MNTSSGRPPVRISSVTGLLAVIPHLLGFTPTDSLVVVGVGRSPGASRSRSATTCPTRPTPAPRPRSPRTPLSVLARQQLTDRRGRRVRPRAAGHPARRRHPRRLPPAPDVELRDVLRVDDGRYWSYLCRSRRAARPRVSRSTPPRIRLPRPWRHAGQPVLPGRAALAATIAPVTGADAEAMARGHPAGRAGRARLITRAGPQALERPGLAAVRAAIRRLPRRRVDHSRRSGTPGWRWC